MWRRCTPTTTSPRRHSPGDRGIGWQDDVLWQTQHRSGTCLRHDHVLDEQRGCGFGACAHRRRQPTATGDVWAGPVDAGTAAHGTVLAYCARSDPAWSRCTDQRLPRTATLLVTNVQDQNDTITATISPQTRPTLLVHSTMAAAEWRADVYDGTQWLAAQTVSVNGVFLGVVVPAGAQTVRLRWVSAVQWMWVSHLVWGGIWLWYGVWLVRRYRSRRYD